MIAQLHFITVSSPATVAAASVGNDATTPDAGYSDNALGQPLEVLTSSTSVQPATRIAYDYSTTTLQRASELLQIDHDLTFVSSSGTVTVSAGSAAATFTLRCLWSPGGQDDRQHHQIFAYDGWNLVAEYLNTSGSAPALARSLGSYNDAWDRSDYLPEIGDFSTILGNDPFGVGRPLDTLRQTYDWNETVGF